MTKLAHFLTSLLLVIVCAGVWFVWRIAGILFAAHHGGSPLMEPAELVLNHHDWIWALPFPALGYSAVLMDRHELPVERVVVYALVIACISAVLVLGTVGLIGWEVSFARGPSLGTQ